jgi:hypothetical protein
MQLSQLCVGSAENTMGSSYGPWPSTREAHSATQKSQSRRALELKQVDGGENGIIIAMVIGALVENAIE